MGTEPRYAEPFKSAALLFFIFVSLGLGVAAFSNAPLSFDGAFFLFRVLDSHQFAADHGRLINIPLQVPTLVAAHFTQNLGVLRFIFCTAYAMVPAVGLLVSWLICRSRRPSLFIWPAMSVCLAELPGQFSFHSESIMAVTLLWPVLLMILAGGPLIYLPLVAITTIAASVSHPNAIGILAYLVLVAIGSAIVRPQARKASLGFAFALGVLLLAKAVAPLDRYEGHAFALATVVRSFRDSVIGWPLVALICTFGAALSCIRSAQPLARTCLIVPLIAAGAALVLWSIHPSQWMSCNDYRYWVAPFSMALMVAATFEELRRGGLAETQLQYIRRYALPLLGAIFMVVVSIQSWQFGQMSRRLISDLADSDRGCISWIRYGAQHHRIRDSALGHWAVTVYAVELQGRKPATLLLPGNLACHLFALTGDAVLVDNGIFTYVKHRGEGWFDFEDARSGAPKPREPPSQ